ncbi:MAG: dihydropteroate synthase [Haemophilus parainfluenzae]|nr:dihydropteroate synthase [Haemophilus parainfluenzae]
MKLYANNKCLDLSFPQIMGILNFTPDSFSDSGQFFSLDKALFQVEKMLKEGAISVDTSKAMVMQEAAKVGMDLINDIRALREPSALEIAGQLNLPTCIMHMQGQPRTMQTNPHYDDVVQDVYQFLNDRTQACLAAGIAKENIIWDTGFGFGKTVQHNYKLLQQLAHFCESGYPILAGLSRKSMIGAVLDKPVTDRVVGSVAGALIAAQNGATILRVHDVAATADALKVWRATQQA